MKRARPFTQMAKPAPPPRRLRASSPLGLLALVCCLGVPVVAQTGRIVAHLDGNPRLPLKVEGEARYVHEPGRRKEGLAALRLRPSPDDEFFGIRIGKLSGRAPKAVQFWLYHEGDEPYRYHVKLEDERGFPRASEAAFLRVAATRGWNRIRLDLRVKTRSGHRELDFRHGIRRLHVSRRRLNLDLPGFILDDIRLMEEELAPLATEARAALAIEDPNAQSAALRDTLPLVPEAARRELALLTLNTTEHEASRRVAREALATCTSDVSVKGLIKALKTTRDTRRVELCWALASMASSRARREALRRAKAGKTPTLERAALVSGLARRHLANDLAPLLKACGPRDAWPPRAALVECLRMSACARGVDLLIDVLERPGSPRVAGDAELALAELTGKRLGNDASAWRAWWSVNRGSARLTTDGTPPNEGYATYYGIPVRGGRIAFVLDLSGSMHKGVGGKRAQQHIRRSEHLRDLDIQDRLTLAKAELNHVLKNLPDGAAVGVIFYNDGVHWGTKGMRKLDRALRNHLKKRLDALTARGSTNIHDGLAAAFLTEGSLRHSIERGPDTVFLLTDGNPSVGPIAERNTLRDAVIRWNLGRRIRIHTINVGALKSRWLSAIADDSGGVFVDLHWKRKKRGSKRDR